MAIAPFGRGDHITALFEQAIYSEFSLAKEAKNKNFLFRPEPGARSESA
jgi:hypothetical protein